ncbi:hypothetical protein VNI00_005876 [Paramarasmius palmivorus]|uniref:F-box protein n=1 Tax=Paramarasmius palmivorus TaxID=297713 RepID=A0AAW0DAB2_9AGAR
MGQKNWLPSPDAIQTRITRFLAPATDLKPKKLKIKNRRPFTGLPLNIKVEICAWCAYMHRDMVTSLMLVCKAVCSRVEELRFQFVTIRGTEGLHRFTDLVRQKPEGFLASRVEALCLSDAPVEECTELLRKCSALQHLGVDNVRIDPDDFDEEPELNDPWHLEQRKWLKCISQLPLRSLTVVTGHRTWWIANDIFAATNLSSSLTHLDLRDTTDWDLPLQYAYFPNLTHITVHQRRQYDHRLPNWRKINQNGEERLMDNIKECLEHVDKLEVLVVFIVDAVTFFEEFRNPPPGPFKYPRGSPKEYLKKEEDRITAKLRSEGHWDDRIVIMENPTLEAEYDECSHFDGWNEQWKDSVVPSEDNFWMEAEKIVEARRQSQRG